MLRPLFILLLFNLFCLHQNLVAQPDALKCTVCPHLDLNFFMGIPVNEFADNTDALGFGGRLAFNIPLSQKTPLYFGFGFGALIFGSSGKYINEEVTISSGNTVIGTIPVNIEARTNNWMVNALVALRYKLPFNYVQPYGELLCGGSYFWTGTTLYDRTNNGWLSDSEDNVINSRTLSSSFTYNFGGGLGLLIRLSDKIYLNIGGTYLKGSKAKYFDKEQTSQWEIQFSGSGPFNPNDVDPDDIELENTTGKPKKSRTDMIQLSVGIAAFIGD